jgi:secreted PhoX family phosphatase
MLSGSPFAALGARVALGQDRPETAGYGPLVPKAPVGGTEDPTQILALPAEFNYQVIDRQGLRQRDGNLTPGIFDAMGAFPGGGEGGSGDRTILIRNHENRERPGEIPVTVPNPYDPATIGGCTKLVVERSKLGRDLATDQQLYEYEVIDKFNIIGGTSTNCAGGEVPFKKWITCEEVVKGPSNSPSTQRHGYNFEVDAMSDGPVEALPILAAGRFVHEATAWRAGVLYETEDRSLQTDPRLGTIEACFYRYVLDERAGQSSNLAETTGVLEAAMVKGKPNFDFDAVTTPGTSFPIEWVVVDDPDHADDTDNRRDRVRGFTPTRIQAQDKGAGYFDRMEGLWVEGAEGQGGSIFFDCTTGGPRNLGQVWKYDEGRDILTLVYVSTNRQQLENPDYITIVQQTGDIFLCEDSPGEQYIRGLTQEGEIYDFALALTNDTEFRGAVFDPDRQTLYVNQQGERGIEGLPETPMEGPVDPRAAVTYAIYGPFEKRFGDSRRGNGPSAGNGSGA